MQEIFKQALKDVSDICKFEHWLRFYFIQGNGDDLQMRIPEETMEWIRQEYEELSGLAENLNNRPITPEKSQLQILHYIHNNLDSSKYETSVINSVLNSKSLEVEITAFHIWVNAHEDQLDKDITAFKDWMQHFEAWKRTEKGHNMLMQLKETGSGGEAKQQ